MDVDRNMRNADRGIPNDFIEIVDLVEKATKDNRISWTEDPPGSGKIIIHFERFQIALWLEDESGEGESSYVLTTVFFEVQSDKGHPVGGFFTDHFGNMPKNDAMVRLERLYFDAFTQSRNLDNALKEIKQELRIK
ncbi:MAG: hypothetical protein ABSB25_07640 [Sedimentisphaerales bacterium]|jgi:hypothetical protein